MTDRIPYTYIIGWSSLNKWYYGVRYAKNCKPEDLWKTYFTSSKYVKEFKKINGDPDIIEVRKTFNDNDKAILWETRVLKWLKVIERDDFLNKTNNVAISSEACRKGVETQKNMDSHPNKGRKNLGVSIRNSKLVKDLNPMWGKRGELSPCYGRTGEKHPMFGKKNLNASIAAKIKIECPHCSKVGNIANMKRWHFDKCKINNKKQENNHEFMG